MVSAMESEHDGLGRILFILCFGQIAGLEHLSQHHIASLLTALGIADRIEERGILAQTDEQCCLVEGQVLGLLIKIGVGRCLDAHSTVEEIEIVEIERDDLFLGEVAFKLDGCDPLDGFLQQSLRSGLGRIGIELLGKLLRDRTAATGTCLPHQPTLDDGSSESDEVYARMLIESLILRSH